jgi:hypothetical protein
MDLDLRVEPIGDWPGEATESPGHSPFQADYDSTTVILDHELHWHGARATVVQMDVNKPTSLRASLKPDSPGVIVSFTTAEGMKLRFACDRFWRWSHNLRAIALGLKALRTVERYGIVNDGQQFAGFRALESAESARGFESIEDAARFVVHLARPDLDDDKIERRAGVLIDDDEMAASEFRRAAKNAHPDVGGDDATMARLASARALIEGAT